MTIHFWMDNLLAYSLQIAILAAAGSLLAYLFRLRLPGVLLIYWQVLLLLCLFVPALQTWKHTVIVAGLAAGQTVRGGIPEEAVSEYSNYAGPILPQAITLILAAGIVLRLMWLGLGCFRLRHILRNSSFPAELWPAVRKMQSKIGVQVRLLMSREIDTPITFGINSPIVVLPLSYCGMNEPCREAVLYHELLHVRRRDWILIVVEEIIRGLYWFHPAVWWLLGRIHLAREQSVDRDVVQLTGNRQPYLDSLLEIARTRGRPKAIPATLFLTERHLVQRVALLIKEASMNRLRLAVSLIGIAMLLVGTVQLAAAWFPLMGTPVLSQEQPVNAEAAAPLRDPIRVGGNVQESRLVYKIDPIYPELAKRARISGRVVLTVTVNEEGRVYVAEVNTGHPLLSDAALSAVKQWRYSPTLLNGEPVPVMATVAVMFARDGQNASITTGMLAMPSGPVPPPPPPPVQRGPIPSRDGISAIIRSYQEAFSTYRTYQGRGYYSAGGNISGPELALDHKRLHTLATAGWPPAVEKTLLVYTLYINEVGEMVGVVQTSGPEISELEKELARTRVVAPGRRGADPVPVFCVVEIDPR